MPKGVRYNKGDVVLVEVPEDEVRGHEQHSDNPRPAVVMSLMKRSRYGLVAVVFITSRDGNALDSCEVPVGPDDVTLGPGEAGLTREGLVLCDHLRFIDPSRIVPPRGEGQAKRLGKATHALTGRIEGVLLGLLAIDP